MYKTNNKLCTVFNCPRALSFTLNIASFPQSLFSEHTWTKLILAHLLLFVYGYDTNYKKSELQMFAKSLCNKTHFYAIWSYTKKTKVIKAYTEHIHKL